MAKVGPRLQTIGHELVLPTKGQPCHILHPNNLRGGMGHAGLLLFCNEGLKWGVGLTVALKRTVNSEVVFGQQQHQQQQRQQPQQRQQQEHEDKTLDCNEATTGVSNVIS